MPGAKMRSVHDGLYCVTPRKASARASQIVHAPTAEADRQQKLDTAMTFATVLEKQLAKKTVGCATIVEASHAFPR